MKKINMKKKVIYTDIISDWLTNEAAGFKASTYVKYCQIYKKYIIPFFSEINVNKVDDSLLEQYKSYLLSSNMNDTTGSLSNGTLRSISMLVNKGLQGAKQYNRDIPTIFKMKLKNNKKQINVFTEQEQRKLETFLKSNRDISTTCILLCLYTGLRVGELCALRWSDINAAEGYISVSRTVQRLQNISQDNSKTNLIVTSPKSDTSRRMIPLPDFLIPVMESYYSPEKRSAYILSGTSENPMDPRTMQYRYKCYLNKAGVEYRNFHTLRHTFATRCITAGMDIKSLSELLGHSSVQITLNYYCHTTMDFKRQQINLLKPLSQI